MSNEEFDNLKEELMWEGSSVVMLSKRILRHGIDLVMAIPNQRSFVFVY